MAGPLQTFVWPLFSLMAETPVHILVVLFVALLVSAIFSAYVALHLVAPKPRLPLPSEKTYLTTNPDGTTSAPRRLPCWYDRWLADRQLRESRTESAGEEGDGSAAAAAADASAIDPPEVAVTVVVPAYNEAARICPALEEMVEYLDEHFGRRPGSAGGSLAPPSPASGHGGGARDRRPGSPATPHRLVFKKPGPAAAAAESHRISGGYEILVVDDESRDGTAEVALRFGRTHGLHDVLRVVRLGRNRGKGGAVTHGFRHARGEYVVFADADGASRFSDLGRLVEGCEDVVDGSGRGVAIGSRAHLVGSEAVVRRSAVRNFLMRSFHFVLMILTPPATSRIRDTQCGFKLFSRAALPHIVPYMHAEGWIFDIEMLMLAESAPATPVLAADGAVIGTSYGIKVAEVPVAWHEVDGSKMSLVRDSVSMALGLAVLRASWMLGVYRRRLT